MFKIVIVIFGNQHTASALDIILNKKLFHTGMLWLYVVSSALSVVLTQIIMVFTHTEHSPACSTAFFFVRRVSAYMESRFIDAWRFTVSSLQYSS